MTSSPLSRGFGILAMACGPALIAMSSQAAEWSGTAKLSAGTAQDQASLVAPQLPRQEATSWLAGGMRLDAKQALGDSLAFNFSYALHGRQGRPQAAYLSKALEEGSTQGYRIKDLRYRDYTGFPAEADTQYRQNLDRLFVGWKLSDFDITAGRQAITWGVARGVRPLEFITQNTLSALEAEERNGVDALRVRAPVSAGFGEVDAGVVFGHDLEQRKSAAYVRGVTQWGAVELTTLASRYLGNSLYGVGLYTSVNKIGVRMEATRTITDHFAGQGTGPYTRSTLGMDYALTRESYTFVEYHYNGAGAVRQAEVPRLMASQGYRTQSLLLLRRHYLVGGVGYQPDPASKFSAYTVYGMSNSDYLLNLAYQYEIGQDWYLNTRLIGGVGDSQTEFGGFGKALDIGLNHYF